MESSESQISVGNHPPEEVIAAEILHQLPTKSIGILRCVLKEWRCFLSSQDFVLSHLKFHLKKMPQTHLILAGEKTCYLLTLNDGSRDSDGAVKQVKNLFGEESKCLIMGSSCHGLVTMNVGDDGHVRVLMNPITGESVRVRNWPIGGVCSMVHGLGYDASSEDYKIVNVSWSLEGRSIDVYSVRKKVWRNRPKSRDGFEPHVPLNGRNGVYVGGSIHWVCHRDANSYECVICAFDVAVEEFREVTPPAGVKVDLNEFQLTLLGGCLALYQIDSFRLGSRGIVWLMKRYGVGDSWTKITINIPESLYGDDPFAIMIKPAVISLLNQEEFLLNHFERFFAYNYKTGGLRELVISGSDSVLAHHFGAVPIGESLLSPN